MRISLANKSGAAAYFDDLTARGVAPRPYQENHYDPFSLNLDGIETAQPTQNAQYQYNGKEKQTDFGLNWQDYGARMYNSELGRFSAVDNYAEKYYDLTPYQYAANNPLRYVDVNGDSIWVNSFDNN